MKKYKNNLVFKPTLLFLFLFFSVAIKSEAADEKDTKDRNNAEEGTHKNFSGSSGIQLWNANCGRCHNRPAPNKYSDGQWEIIVHHMRTRANLTGKEASAIGEFLKSAN